MLKECDIMLKLNMENNNNNNKSRSTRKSMILNNNNKRIVNILHTEMIEINKLF